MNNKGFTLIELLIVMVIIAILAGISIFGLQGAREAGRDGKRKGDLESIRSALELHRADCGIYPGNFPTSGTFTGNAADCDGVSNTYMQQVPEDPNGTPSYNYNVGAGNQSYCLCATLEQIPATSPPCSGSGNYCVANP